MITIVDYSVGNINSVANMIRHVGLSFRITGDPDEVSRAEKLLLPGVGAFDKGMGSLTQTGLAEALTFAVLRRGVPILGVCLGMQLMTKSSQEGRLPGLGWIDGETMRFSFPEGSSLKVPHMGWNSLTILRENPLVVPEERQRFYFVHSYHVVCSDDSDVIALCQYGYEFVAVFGRDNIWGVQFHPEKSHRFGMNLMRRFGEI